MKNSFSGMWMSIASSAVTASSPEPKILVSCRASMSERDVGCSKLFPRRCRWEQSRRVLAAR